MKQTMLWLCGLAALTFVVCPAPAANNERAGGQRSPATRPAPSVIQGQYAIFVSEAGLNDEQKARLEVIIKAGKEKAAAWDAENDAKVKQLTEASKDKTTDAGKQAAKDLRELQAAKNKINSDLMAEAVGLLQGDQKTKWESFELFVGAKQGIPKGTFTEEQDKQARQLAADAQKKISGLSEAKEIAAAKADLKKQVGGLLTAEQKDSIQKAKAAASQAAATRPAAGQTPTPNAAASKPAEPKKD